MMKKFLKQIALIMVSAIVTSLLVHGGFAIYASNLPVVTTAGSALKTVYSDAVLAQAYNRYHNSMNEFFNAKMKHLNELIDAEDFENKDFIPPSQDKLPNLDPVKDDRKEILKKCTEANVSTYCVSMGALDLYIDYLNSLKRLKTSLANSSGDSITELIASTSTRNENINRELEEAKRVLEATVSAYNEYRLAYPMHKKYQQIAANLVLYRSALNEINRQLVTWPVEFVDATTHKCP